MVGLYFSDEHEKAPGYVPSHAPIVWMAAKVDGESQQIVYAKLDADPPSGWYTGRRWYGERPYVWRPLGPVLDPATIDEQRDALAQAVSVGREWIERAMMVESQQEPEPQL